jgi:5'-phosphate synthase pdxT subunit
MSIHLVKKTRDKIGVLDLQGGVQEHLAHLDRLTLPYRKVKEPPHFEDLAGLIIPGGESTCLTRLLHIFGLKDHILEHHAAGMKIWGTCAGAILLAKHVIGEKSCLGVIDIDIERNSFGSQLDSFVTEALIPVVAADPIPLTFIRAPKILRAGKNVNVLLQIDDYIAAAENRSTLATVFHPELTPNLSFHRYFARKCGLSPAEKSPKDQTPDWGNLNWMKHARIAS